MPVFWDSSQNFVGSWLYEFCTKSIAYHLKPRPKDTFQSYNIKIKWERTSIVIYQPPFMYLSHIWILPITGKKNQTENPVKIVNVLRITPHIGGIPWSLCCTLLAAIINLLMLHCHFSSAEIFWDFTHPNDSHNSTCDL